LVLQTEAIRIINQRITDCKDGKLSDSTIAAVASLASYEVWFSSYNAQSPPLVLYLACHLASLAMI
jgi:hypothetical protein